MKFKSIILTITLCLCTLFATLGLSACKGVSLDNLKTNFEKLDAQIQALSEGENVVFESGSFEGLQSNLIVSGYGEYIDKQIQSLKEESESDKEEKPKVLDGIADLVDLYNVTLVISDNYVNSNKAFVLGLDEKTFSKETKQVLESLNGSVVDFTNALSKFSVARNDLIDHFTHFAGIDTDSDLASVLKFKKVYGDLVRKNVTLSENMAKMVETTRIFDVLKNKIPTVEDTATLKAYIRAKLLPLYSEFQITEFANNMNWNSQKDGDGVTKKRITTLLTNVGKSFGGFKNNFLTNKVKTQPLSKEEFKELLDLSEMFFVESQSYFKALRDINFSSLSVGFDNNMKEYLKTNEMAEIYLQKLEQFVEFSIGDFMDAVALRILID